MVIKEIFESANGLKVNNSRDFSLNLVDLVEDFYFLSFPQIITINDPLKYDEDSFEYWAVLFDTIKKVSPKGADYFFLGVPLYEEYVVLDENSGLKRKPFKKHHPVSFFTKNCNLAKLSNPLIYSSNKVLLSVEDIVLKEKPIFFPSECEPCDSLSNLFKSDLFSYGFQKVKFNLDKNGNLLPSCFIPNDQAYTSYRPVQLFVRKPKSI